MKNGMRTIITLLIGIWVIGLLTFLSVPTSTQERILVALADGSGTTQTARAATLTNFQAGTTLTARSLSGAQLMSHPSSWIVNSAPAANSRGTVSIAAEAAVRHVVDCIGWSANAAAAVTAAVGSVVVRDGATGAGTIILPIAVSHLVAAGAGVQTVAPGFICGLNVPGTTNTAMTIEFDAGVTGEAQAVWMSGVNVQ